MSSQVTSFATSSIAQMYPIVLAVAGAMVALLVLMWGVNAVLRVLRGGDPAQDPMRSVDFSVPESFEDDLVGGYASLNGDAVDGGGSFL